MGPVRMDGVFILLGSEWSVESEEWSSADLSDSDDWGEF